MIPNILGIDYGEARIGLALATTPLAEPLEVVENKKAIARISQIVLEQQIGLIVIGLSESKTAQRTMAFASQLEKQLSCPIVFFDETLSTQEMMQKLISSGSKRKKRRQATDHFAAATILQDYMDSGQDFNSISNKC